MLHLQNTFQLSDPSDYYTNGGVDPNAKKKYCMLSNFGNTFV